MSTYNVTVENTGSVVTVIDEIINVVVNDEVIRVVTIAEQGPPGTSAPANIIVSEPEAGEYRVTNIRLDADKKILITYWDEPIT